MITAVGLIATLATSSARVRAQALPPPRDGDIRVLYHELRDLTEVWLTLEPIGPGGESLPISLTMNAVFTGKRPAAPLGEVEMRAWVGRLWAPRPVLTLTLNGRETLDLAGPNPRTLTGGDMPPDSYMRAVVATVPMETLNRIAAARSISGNALRLEFALSDSQREAISRFAQRVQSPDPGQASTR